MILCEFTLLNCVYNTILIFLTSLKQTWYVIKQKYNQSFHHTSTIHSNNEISTTVHIKCLVRLQLKLYDISSIKLTLFIYHFIFHNKNHTQPPAKAYKQQKHPTDLSISPYRIPMQQNCTKDTRPSRKYIRGFSAIELFERPSSR